MADENEKGGLEDDLEDETRAPPQDGDSACANDNMRCVCVCVRVCVRVYGCGCECDAADGCGGLLPPAEPRKIVLLQFMRCRKIQRLYL